MQEGARFFRIPEGVLCLGDGSKWDGWVFSPTKEGGYMPLRKLDLDFVLRAKRAQKAGALVEMTADLPPVPVIVNQGAPH
jgi:hypothetical protein